MPPINFNHLYYFYEIARAGSFTQAARALSVSQSALSVQVRSLEDSIGGPLFDRRRGGVELTESGERAFQSAERAFRDIDEMLTDLRAEERRDRGDVHIGTVNSIGIYVLPELMTGYTQAFPDVGVRIDFQEAEGVTDLVVQGRIDVAIVPWRRPYPGLTGVSLRKIKMFLVAPPDHPLADRPTVQPRELEAFDFVGYREGMYTRSMLDALFKRMSMSVEYSVESSNSATIKHMVMAGMGLGILPDYSVASELRGGQLVRLVVPTLHTEQEMMLYYRKNRTLPAAVRGFIEFLKAHFAPKPVRGR